ncbi:MAG: hypothetical protein WCO71_09270, partial [Pseudomonadota bacterium]
SRAKAVYAKGERTILVEIPNIPKSRQILPPLDKLKLTGKPKRSNRIANPPKKYAQKPLRAATSLKRNRTAGVVARCEIKRLESAPEASCFFISMDTKHSHSLTITGQFLSNRRNPSRARD